MLRMTPLTVEGKPLDVAARLAELTGFVTDAARDRLPAHELERGLWQYLLRLGHDCRPRILPWRATATAARL